MRRIISERSYLVKKILETLRIYYDTYDYNKHSFCVIPALFQSKITFLINNLKLCAIRTDLLQIRRKVRKIQNTKELLIFNQI